MAGKKILMLTGEFTEEYEIFVYQQGMMAVGHTVHVVCPDKKAGDRIKTSLHDFEGDQTYTEKMGHYADINKTFSEALAQLDQYDAVYCAGGRGPEYIRTDKRIQQMVKHFHDANKPIFTICHGVQILIAVDGVVRGKRVAALAACEPEVTLAGGTYVDLSPTELADRWHHGFGQGLDRACRLHARLPQGAGHRDQARLIATTNSKAPRW